MAILTVSREFGSGGREIAHAVADAMNYEYVDKETFLNDIRQIGHKWEEWAKDLDEHHPSVWEKYDWSFRGFGALIQSTILNYAAKDRAVIMGRGGNILLEGVPFSLRICVVAPLAARIERIIKRESVDRGTAHWVAEKMGRERSGFIHCLYGKRWEDRAGYDKVVDTGAKSIEEIVASVTRLLLERDCLGTEDVRRDLEMRSAAAKIKAGLATNPAIFIPTLSVVWDGRRIVLQGVVHNPREHRRIEEAARKLAGDFPLKCELHYRE